MPLEKIPKYGTKAFVLLRFSFFCLSVCSFCLLAFFFFFFFFCCLVVCLLFLFVCLLACLLVFVLVSCSCFGFLDVIGLWFCFS